MPDPLTSLVLVFALAAGLGAAIVVAQHVQTDGTAFYRHYLTHILLFNLLILAGLVFRYLQPQAATTPLAVPLVLTVMTALKLGWLYSFTLCNHLLAGHGEHDRFTLGTRKAGLVLLVLFAACTWAAWLGRLPMLLNATLLLLEFIVLAGAAIAALSLLRETGRLPGGARRQSMRQFGLFHLVLLLAVIAALAASWLRPGPEELEQLLVNGAFLLLFNLFPPYWIRRFRPVPEETADGRFEALGITRREREVVQLIQAGRTNQEIADELFISLATVKDHNNNLFRKCGVRNRVELANLFR